MHRAMASSHFDDASVRMIEPMPDQALSSLREALSAANRRIDQLVVHNGELRQQLACAQRKENAARIDACHDALTGLPNRRLLNDRLHQVLARADRHQWQVALLLIDLDGFKAVNDRCGHAQGDQLLRAVATRLAACIRASDTACRYGGDEFVIVIPELDEAEAIETVTEKIHACMALPYLLSGSEVTVRASIGCAVYPADGRNHEQLIAHADASMYRSKRLRKQEPGCSSSVCENARHLLS